MSLSGHSTDGGETEEIHRAEQVGGGGLWRHHAVPAPPGDGAGTRLPAEVPGQTNHRLLLLWALGKIGEIADRCKWWILFSICSVLIIRQMGWILFSLYINIIIKFLI